MKQFSDVKLKIKQPSEFPNKFCERPIFEKVLRHGHTIEELTGYIRWHADNPDNKIKLDMTTYFEQEKKEVNEEWDSNKKRTKGLLEKERFFESLKNNQTGQKFIDDKIVEFINKEDKEVKLMF